MKMHVTLGHPILIFSTAWHSSCWVTRSEFGGSVLGCNEDCCAWSHPDDCS